LDHPVFKDKLALFEALDLQLIGAAHLLQCQNGRIKITVFLFEAHEFAFELLAVFIGQAVTHGVPFKRLAASAQMINVDLPMISSLREPQEGHKSASDVRNAFCPAHVIVRDTWREAEGIGIASGAKKREKTRMTIMNCFGAKHRRSFAPSIGLALGTLISFGIAAPVLAQERVPESLITAARDKPQRVIILMASPKQGGQQEAYRQPEAYIANALGKDARRTSGILDQPLVVTEISRAGLLKLQRNESVLQVFPDTLMKTSLPQSTQLLDVPLVWEKQTRGSGVSIAILDTGLQTQHPFVKDRLVAEACFSSTSEAQKSTTLCANGQGEMVGAGASEACDFRAVTSNCVHGTHVAGIAAGANGEADGAKLFGVAPEAGLVAVKVFSRFDGEEICGKGTPTCISAWTSDVLKGLLFVEQIAAEKKIASVNLSLGSGKHDSACNDKSAYSDVVGRLTKAGIAVVAAAGNEGFDKAIAEPACVSGVIAVGATTKEGAIDTNYSNSSQQVTIAAPGSQILSSAADGYYKLDGTSMAAPHVAGLFALLRAHYPKASLAELQEAVIKTGKSVKDPRNGLQSILPDAEAAVLALGGGSAEPTPGPTPNEPDPRVAGCGPVCIEEGKDMRRIIFVLAKGQDVTPQTIAALKTSFGAGAKVEDIGDGKLLVELPVQPKADDIDRARKDVGDGTKVLPDEPLKTLEPGQTIKIQ
jgi:subtilisin family serine protease